MEKKFLKLICGAGNENLKEIEKLAYIFSSADFNMIDLSAKQEVINAAKSGIKRASKENNVSICVSVGLSDDIHLTKAVINKQKCTLCKACENICPQNAIFEEDNKLSVNEKKCIGCQKCVSTCPNGAILTDIKNRMPYAMLLPIISSGIDCVEFHCSGADTKEIVDSWNKIKTIYSGQLSICLDRSKLGDENLIKLLKEMIADNDNIIIQADGKPMSGGIDDYKSTLQTVAFAELIRNNNLPVKIITSGGTNSKTSELAKIIGVKIDGVALGSYARKLVKEEIDRDDFFENIELQNSAILKAKDLAKKIKENF